MFYCLQSFVVYHLVVVKVEQFMQLKNLLPIYLLQHLNKVKVFVLGKFFHLLFQASHFHLEDSSERTGIGQDFAIRRFRHVAVEIDGPCGV